MVTIKDKSESINSRNPNLLDDGRAEARNHAIASATAATTGQGGLDEGNAAKAALEADAADNE